MRVSNFEKAFFSSSLAGLFSARTFFAIRIRVNRVYYFDKHYIAKEFICPNDYVDFVRLGFDLKSPWWLLESRPDFAMSCFKMLNENLESDRLLIPFAKNDDNGDIACFDGNNIVSQNIYFYTGEETLKGVDWSNRYFLESFSDFLSSTGNVL